MSTRAIMAVLSLLVTAAHAQGPEPHVPETLQPWTQWVLDDDAGRLDCPIAGIGGSGVERACIWPGELRVQLSDGGARFSQSWRALARGWAPLPGGRKAWPSAVAIDGTAATIGEDDNGNPRVWLTPGQHELTGRFQWTNRPQTLALPSSTALVALEVDGKTVARPRRDDDALWLGEQETNARQAQADALEVWIYRRLSDGHPQELTTRVRLNVSGAARERVLGQVLWGPMAPLAVDSGLPARLRPDGRLEVQLRPGQWSLSVRARLTERVQSLTLPPAVGSWPEQEVWSYRSMDRLRVTELDGGAAIDAQRAGVPGEWRELPTYRVEHGQTIEIVEHGGARALPENRLSLERQMWLGFDGERLTSKDRITGRMAQDWRLDMQSPYRLRRAEEAGEPVLITTRTEGRSGVELRRRQTDVTAVSEVSARGGAVPITGWLARFQDVDIELQLPPGYRLLTATGIARAQGSWIAAWSLLELFLVAVVAVGAGRLLGVWWGLVAGLGLVLSLQEPSAPRWLWLNALAAAGLLAVAPEGWLRRIVRTYGLLSVLALLVVLVPFAVEQGRAALYPQLGPEGDRGIGVERQALRQRAEEAAASKLRQPAGRAMTEMAGSAADSSVRQPRSLERFQSDAVIQAGPGVPDWRWQRVRLASESPVAAERRMRLVVLSPWWTALWRLAGIAALAALAVWLARRILSAGHWPRLGAGAAALVVLLAGGSGAQASEWPSDALLQELRERLLRPPECSPQCAVIRSANMAATDGVLELELEIHAAAAVAVSVPGADDGWRPAEVRVDGQRRSWLRRSAQGQRQVPLTSAGIHAVTLRGPLPAADTVTLGFPLRPKSARFQSRRWHAKGLVDGRLQSDTLELIRKADDDGPAAATGTVNIPPFVRVTRRLHFGTQWLVDTSVERVAPREAGFSVSIPLLPGATPISAETEGVELADDRARVAFARGQTRATWRSRLPRRSSLSLTAADAGHFTEVWRLDIAPQWHAELDGMEPLPPPVDDRSTSWSPELLPLPKQTLSLALTRPEAVAGNSLALDRVRYRRQLAAHTANTQVELDFRTTRSQTHRFAVPEEATLINAESEAATLGTREPDGRVPMTLPLGPSSVTLEWRRPIEGLTRPTSETVPLDVPAANIDLRLQLPGDRWVLLAGGPDMGPAVLYWSELALVLVLALGLGRVRRLPVTRGQWLLLALGLSLTAWPVLLVFAAWLLALRWRSERFDTEVRWRFNATQLVLGVISVLAVGLLVAAIPMGLIGDPGMGISGHGSSAHSLHWFQDRAEDALPAAWAITLPLWCYKVLMLAWAVWLAFALIGWLKWGWGAWSHGGIWRGKLAKA